ncbi:cyclin-O [Clinocottus analis]|uniref:cyclin-O n=1 Tax=Clinocottus analis TaxID=304258 RepID=UPI0035C1401A
MGREVRCRIARGTPRENKPTRPDGTADPITPKETAAASGPGAQRDEPPGDMVTSKRERVGSEPVRKRRRAARASSPPAAAAEEEEKEDDEGEAQRKQTLVSKLSDSGFEEDLDSSMVCSPAQTAVSPLRSAESPSGQLSTWYLQYGDACFSIQRDVEAQFQSEKSLACQPQLTAQDRCRLVSWLVPVHKHFGLSFECCCLTVNIVDRFTAAKPVAADCFQLLGVTALLLASKQVEGAAPWIRDLLSLCCGAYTREQLCNLEGLVLRQLNFRLTAPTLAFFLDYYTCAEAARLERGSGSGGRGVAKGNGRRRELARKVCELSLADYAFNAFPPSLTAGCALRIAGELLAAEQGELRAQPGESPETCRADPLEARGPFWAWLEQGPLNHSLAQECKDNLKQLVSLNQQSLEVF